MKIAYQGRPGAYSENAALQIFGEDSKSIGLDDFTAVYQAVDSGEADAGVLPIENSTAGSILENFDLLLQWGLPIVAEIKIQVEHVLMALPQSSVADLEQVISHPQALAQCSDFFAQNPHIKPMAFFDTAGSAEEVLQRQDPKLGAIASVLAAKSNQLQVLRSNLENHPGTNFTRFFAIQKNAAGDTSAHNKISIAFGALDKHGALYHALGCFARRLVNLLRIESRPKPGSPWEYIFYLDLEGNLAQNAVQAALEELKQESAFVKILGSYVNGEHRPMIQRG
ncbi:MAG: prephenate dehydratase [Fibrobacter sp.]|nr:prephenate dehydratase [Fibrobacter sp.]